MIRFELYTLDVWGNAAEGYEVNDSFRQGTIELPEQYTHSQVLDAIDARIGVRGREFAEFTVDDGDFLEISESNTGMPVFHLYRRES